MKRCFHIASNFQWNSAPGAGERARLQRMITAAIRRAVENTAGEAQEIMVSDFSTQKNIGEQFSVNRFHSDHYTYAVPSYWQGGAPTEIPIAQEQEEMLGVPAQSPSQVVESQSEPEMSLPERITEARRRLRNAEFTSSLREQLPKIYASNAAAGAAALMEAIWSDSLGLGGVTVTDITDRRERREANSIRTSLQQWVNRELSAFFRRTAQGFEARRPELDALISARFQGRPSWDIDELTDSMWSNWLHFGPLDALDRSSRGQAQAAWSRLKQEIHSALQVYFHGALSAAAVTVMDPAEKAAVKAEVLRFRSYFVSASNMDQLTDTIIAQLRGVPVGREDSVWKALRQRITALLIAAETEVIREAITIDPPSEQNRFTEDVWAYVRTLYIQNIEKPIWLFYQEDIVSFTFLGSTTRKERGVHRTVARALPLVERSARRLAGSHAIERIWGGGFRFWPWRDDLMDDPQLSYHASGTAIDFRGTTNPMFGGAAQQLVSVLGAEELYDLFIERRQLTEVVSDISDLLDRQIELLNERERHAEGTPERERVQTELSRIETDLNEIHLRPEVQQLRGQASAIYTRLHEVESAFGQAWLELTGGTGRAEDVNLDGLRARVRAELEANRQTLEGYNPRLSLINTEIERLPSRAHAATRRPFERERQVMQGAIRSQQNRLHRLQDLLNILTAPEQSAAAGVQPSRIRAAQRERDRLLREVANLGRTGTINIPLWLVQAFTEQGWSWGGSWRSSEDAMHFDYLGPVEGVRRPASW